MFSFEKPSRLCEESEVLKSRKEVYQEKLEEYNGRLKEVPFVGTTTILGGKVDESLVKMGIV